MRYGHEMSSVPSESISPVVRVNSGLLDLCSSLSKQVKDLNSPGQLLLCTRYSEPGSQCQRMTPWMSLDPLHLAERGSEERSWRQCWTRREASKQSTKTKEPNRNTACTNVSGDGSKGLLMLGRDKVRPLPEAS